MIEPTDEACKEFRRVYNKTYASPEAQIRASLRAAYAVQFQHVKNAIAAAIAERDAAIERASKYQRTAAELSDKLNGTPCAEIRWQYECDSLRESLKECADDLEAELNDRYGELRHSAMQRQYNRDMDPVVKARAALDGTKKSGEANE